MRASPQQQRLGPLPSSSPFPPNCNPQRCDICPGTTSEGDFHGWSKRTTRELRMEPCDKLGTSFKFFISCDTVNQIPFPYDHVLLTMAHFDVAPVVACVVLTFTAMPCAQYGTLVVRSRLSRRDLCCTARRSACLHTFTGRW